MSLQASERSKQTLMMARIIWGALTVSLHIYVAVVFIAVKPISREDVPAALESALTLVAGLVGAGSIFFRKRSFELNPGLSVGEKWLTVNIISWALNESIAIMGVVLAFVSGVPMKFLPFFAGALALNLIMFPRQISSPR